MMDMVYEGTKDQDSITSEDIPWFYAKSKVPICLAITDSFYFLNKLKVDSILSEEEVLELQGDTRTGHRVVYECLCWIEEKNISLHYFLEFLFHKSFLKKFPDLNPIYAEYKEGRYRYGIQSTADQDKDPLIFAKDKVQICLTITDRFPFLHGLQDLAILSESESLKLQADERPVSRVIYESLSLIEKKDLKLNIVFEYIFQQCYLKLYPGLQDILREPTEESVAPFNGVEYPIFNTTTDLLQFFEHNKTYICEAINERFPFLNGLHDFRLLSHIELLKLQADKRSTKEVLYDAMCQFKTTSDIQNFFAYVFQKFYLKLYPDLSITFNGLNAALTLDICPPSPGQITETQDQGTLTPIIVSVKSECLDLDEQSSNDVPSTVTHEDESGDGQEPDYNEPSGEIVKVENMPLSEQNYSEQSPGCDATLPPPAENCRLQTISYPDSANLLFRVNKKGKKPKGSGDLLPPLVRRCRLQPISYSEPPDFICEVNDQEEKYKVPEFSKRCKCTRRKVHEISSRRFYLKARSGVVQEIKPFVRVEFPKQVFNDNFQVRCGNKKGIFRKARWTGHSSKDLCIDCDGKKFSVTSFEKYGGKASLKNWKKSIHCEKIKLESLIKAGILKRPLWLKNKMGNVEHTVKR
ncbi:sp110 nuclear body protein-like isoform X2 [Dendropsophus ebraccatus]|uniref:sp110 nuclear body protein-like isoform X2 n=1 Tax=Dendropsophus ebraccatus TaxID=150705 RepID=UPI00383212CE